MSNYEDISSELSELGVTENDYWMMTNWMTSDESVFSIDALTNVSKLTPSSDAFDLANKIPHATKEYLSSLTEKTYLLCFLILAVAFSFFFLKKEKAYIYATLLLGLSISVYFTLAGRLPDRVEYPIWMYSLATIAIGITGKPSWGNLSDLSKGIMAFCLVYAFAVQLPHTSISAMKTAFAQTSYTPDNELVAYTDNHPNDIYEYDVFTYMTIESAYSERNLPSTDFLMHNFTLGGWSIGAPYSRARNQALDSQSAFWHFARMTTAIL